MTMPFAYVESDLWCVWCAKRMVVEHGQHEVSGDLVESHHCISCGRTYNTRPEWRSLVLPESTPLAWMTVEQILERRLSAVDREVLSA
jgi:hypothetical protein